MGLDSLRGRYILIATLLFALLGSGVLLGHFFVQQTLHSHHQKMQQQVRVADLVHDLMLRVSALKTSLLDFIILPEEQPRQALQAADQELAGSIASLAQMDWLQQRGGFRDLLQDLERDSRQLRVEIRSLMQLRSDPEKTFPFTTVMIELADINAGFLGAVAAALEDGATDAAGREVRRLLEECRYNWVRVIADFRLLVAIRFGVFTGDSRHAFDLRVENIEMFLQQVATGLLRLAELEEAGRLEFEVSEALAQMRQAHAAGRSRYLQSIEMLRSPAWRADLTALEQRLRPLFASLESSLTGLYDQLEASWVESMRDMGRIAQQLLDFLWWLLVGGIVTTFLGYLFFDRAVLKPIGDVATALRSEAHGGGGEVSFQPGARETRDLCEAFSEMREQVNSRQQRLANILDNTAEAIITIDEGGCIETFNVAAERLLGYRSEEVIGQSLGRLMPEAHGHRHDGYLHEYLKGGLFRHVLGNERELCMRRKDGSEVPVSIKVSETLISGRRLFTALVVDITERKAMLARLQHMAERDPLTNLPNRALFQDRLGHAMAVADHARKGFALLFIDLDKFKHINDSLGHQTGDKVLQFVAGRLLEQVRESDTVARLGGDEFTLILEGMNQIEQAARVAHKILHRLGQPLWVDGHEFHLRASIGIAFYPEDGETADELLKHADIAMYQAKTTGAGGYQFFSPQMNVAAMERLVLEEALRQAVQQGQFELHFQPKVEIASNRIIGAEALLRWRHPERGIIAPDSFIPLAEESGLIVPIGEWVLRTACQQAVRMGCFGEGSRGPCSMAVNVSPRQFQQPDFVSQVERIIAETGVDPGCLELELTEGILIHDFNDVSHKLGALSALGVRLSVDDFGTGYSSLAYLKRLPIDVLKVDRSFVRDVSQDVNDAVIVEAILAMAQHLGKYVSAEGVEDESQLDFLRRNGCDAYQGYLFSRPLPYADFERLLHTVGQQCCPADPLS
ncbi:EAL domain-containing protein [Thiohalobacter sp. IOR34]|uniref:EAL domain-containing protein n=1 Tax=Thiohalobacter sp. IOR34 TaxID=3057176 RepID=UPI0025B08C1F|nr:EAL domain-containing protein [Thiohalobacter sp. IOR34]WJW74808.1 EAL domain-containing protein [Thiohalobacter sp. IOR34]